MVWKLLEKILKFRIYLHLKNTHLFGVDSRLLSRADPVTNLIDIFEEVWKMIDVRLAVDVA